MALDVIILAAGQGKRMFSAKPKVLHPLGGKPMLERVIETAMQLKPNGIYVVYGHQGEVIQHAMAHLPVHWVKQEKQLGTGHAVLQALPYLSHQDKVVVLSGDVPLIQLSTIEKLVALCNGQEYAREPLALLNMHLENPHGFGRIVRDELGFVRGIIEEKDADQATRNIKEVYSGICCAMAKDLQRLLPNIKPNNLQNEIYFTDIVRLAAKENIPIASIETDDPSEVAGVNNQEQLQQLERVLQGRIAKNLMLSGVRIADAKRIDVRGTLQCGHDVFIDVNVVFEGDVVLGEGCIVEPNCWLRNVTVGAHSVIKANSVIEESQIGTHCQIGPFARLRPQTRLESHCKIGNFVETKNVSFDEGSKANHLTYLGDAVIGKKVNIGAGTITCNYDGANKHKTIIEDGVFVGSDTQFVAPIRVGKNATIGAGSTIRRDVPADELTVIEATQKVIRGWKRPFKK